MGRPTTVEADSRGGRTQRIYGEISRDWKRGLLVMDGKIDSKYLEASVKPKSKKKCSNFV